MKQLHYIPYAIECLRPADTGALACRVHADRSGHRMRARLECVLALYPSTTTEIPFT